MQVKADEKDLTAQLKDWGLITQADTVIECWLRFRNDGILPYAGGWLDQPAWVRHDFNQLDAIEAWHQIQNEKPDPPQKGFFDIFRRGK